MGATHWSSVELRYLERHLRAGDTLASIAAHLRRSVNAIRLQARRRGLIHGRGRHGVAGDEMTYSRDELMLGLNITAYRLAQWRARGWLRATSQGHYRRADLRGFLRAHSGELSFADVDPTFFVALAFGSSPSEGDVEDAS